MEQKHFFGEIWALDKKRLEWAVVVVGGKAQGVVVVYGNQRYYWEKVN